VNASPGQTICIRTPKVFRKGVGFNIHPRADGPDRRHSDRLLLARRLRQAACAIVVDPLGEALRDTDIQIGLAQGLAFTGCATIAGVEWRGS